MAHWLMPKAYVYVCVCVREREREREREMCGVVCLQFFTHQCVLLA